MKVDDTVDVRRQMLADWCLAALARHDRVLRSERSRKVVRVGDKSYYVTGECLQNALDATYHELHVALGHQGSWGIGRDGRPSAIAVAGLAQRRLRARLIDQIRRNERILDLVDLSSSSQVTEVAQPGTTRDPADRLGSDVLAELLRESMPTRAAVVLTAAGFTAAEIGSELGIAPHSVRQRTSRFARRLRTSQRAA